MNCILKPGSAVREGQTSVGLSLSCEFILSFSDEFFKSQSSIRFEMTSILDPKFTLKPFDPSRPKRRRQAAPVAAPVEEKTVALEIPTPSTEGLEKEAWLKDDKATGKERDYSCVSPL